MDDQPHELICTYGHHSPQAAYSQTAGAAASHPAPGIRASREAWRPIRHKEAAVASCLGGSAHSRSAQDDRSDIRAVRGTLMNRPLKRDHRHALDSSDVIGIRQIGGFQVSVRPTWRQQWAKQTGNPRKRTATNASRVFEEVTDLLASSAWIGSSRAGPGSHARGRWLEPSRAHFTRLTRTLIWHDR